MEEHYICRFLLMFSSADLAAIMYYISCYLLNKYILYDIISIVKSAAERRIAMLIQKKVLLEGINATLPVEIVTEDGKGLIKHDVLENFILKYPRIVSEYTPVTVDTKNPAAVVMCKMTDTQTKQSVIKVGETNPSTLKTEISRNYGVTMAFQRAFNRAAIALLGLNEGGHIYAEGIELSREDLLKGEKKLMEAADIAPVLNANATFTVQQETAPAPAPVMDNEEKKTETPTYVMTDDTILEIGGQMGKRLGDVKNTKKFRDFLEWVKAPNTIAVFSPKTELAKMQFDYLRVANL